MVKKKKHFGKRALLNLAGHEGVAAISAEIEDTSTWTNNKNRHGTELVNKWQCEPNSSLKISDCSRVIELTVSVSSDDVYTNSLYKVDTMIEALSGLRMGLVTERQRFIERVEKLPKDAQNEIID